MVQFNVQIRKHTMKTKFSCTRYLLHWPIRKLVNWGQSFLSKALLVTCEVAMEYMLALTYSPQVGALSPYTTRTYFSCKTRFFCLFCNHLFWGRYCSVMQH